MVFIGLAVVKGEWRAVLNTVMNLGVAKNAQNLFTS